MRGRSPPALRSYQVDSRGLALLPTLNVVADFLTFVQTAQTRPFHCRDMHEYVLRAIIRLNEAVTFLCIELPDRT